MSDFDQVLLWCMRHTHKSRDILIRKKLKSLDEATAALKDLIKSGMGTEGLILESSFLCGYKLQKFEIKLNQWFQAWSEGRWCTKCGQAPKNKYNRFFCTPCYSKTAGKVQTTCGGGTRICHTGGTGRMP